MLLVIEISLFIYGIAVLVRGEVTLGSRAAKLLRQAHALADLGCFSIVLECVPAELAARITSELTIPTIGIGAGVGTDGQVLVLHDLWGLDTTHVPRSVSRYADGEGILTNALNEYDTDVKATRFPGPGESYS